MTAERTLLTAFLIAVVLGGAAACAKRPAMTEVAAPPPTAAAATTPPAPAPAPPAPAPATPPPAPAAPAAPPPAPAAPAAPSPAPPAPAAVPPRTPPAEFAANPALPDIYFDFDKSVIRPGDAKILDASAGWLKDNARVLVLIEGHCDERGTNEYNLALGDRRAQAARRYLVSRGVAENRITIVSYGEERPTCTARSEACWAKNRRAHFLTRAE